MGNWKFEKFSSKFIILSNSASYKKWHWSVKKNPVNSSEIEEFPSKTQNANYLPDFQNILVTCERFRKDLENSVFGYFRLQRSSLSGSQETDWKKWKRKIRQIEESKSNSGLSCFTCITYVSTFCRETENSIVFHGFSFDFQKSSQNSEKSDLFTFFSTLCCLVSELRFFELRLWIATIFRSLTQPKQNKGQMSIRKFKVDLRKRKSQIGKTEK